MIKFVDSYTKEKKARVLAQSLETSTTLSEEDMSGSLWLRREEWRKREKHINCRSQHVTNTWYTNRKPQLYTCKSPGYINRNQIDLIPAKQWFWGSVKDVKARPNTHIESDHNFLIAKTEKATSFLQKKPKYSFKITTKWQ